MKYFESPEEAVRDLFGSKTAIRSRRPVSGGDINRAYSLRLSDGSGLFMKVNRREKADFFRAEAEGLDAIRDTGTIRVPRTYAAGTDGSDAFLLMEQIEEGRRTPAAMEKLGRALAALHLADVSGILESGKYGFSDDNYIGSSPQYNSPRDSWAEFFVKQRLRPQFMRAAGYWDSSERKKIPEFLEKAAEYLVEPAKPALLHGDLWGGNYMIGSDGEPWLIDPAVYIGHPEADLAMTELFGGFGSSFYKAYNAVSEIDPGYEKRRDLYNLYHLLNHLNCFGAGYLFSVRSGMERYL